MISDMYALRKLLLIMALLFSSSISLFFDSCVMCTILRLLLLCLILLPSTFERICIGLEISGLALSLILSVLQNPLFVKMAATSCYQRYHYSACVSLCF